MSRIYVASFWDFEERMVSLYDNGKEIEVSKVSETLKAEDDLANCDYHQVKSADLYRQAMILLISPHSTPYTMQAAGTLQDAAASHSRLARRYGGINIRHEVTTEN